MIFDTMEHVFKMNMTELGSFNLVEGAVETSEGLRAARITVARSAKKFPPDLGSDLNIENRWLRKKSICCVARQLRRCGAPVVRLTPQFLRALHLELFTKPSFR